MERVSVIMPCYNDGQYIEEALYSLRAQTYLNWELIVIDDGSDEPETLRVLEQLEEMPYVRLLRTNHVRPAGARNAGIQAARGTYILPLDADDTIEPTYMEKAVKILNENPHVGVVYCKADLFGEQSGPWGLPDYSLRAMLQDNIVFVTSMFRREDWERVGGFNTNMHAGMEDYDFWLSILELDREVVQIPEVLFHYRIKPKSRTTGFQNSVEQIKDTYHTLYRNHTALYEKHRELYDLTMRDTMIDLIQQRRVLEEEVARLRAELQKCEILNSVPIWKRVVNKYVY
ncbi:glycosyltransferase, partial [Ruthenibacterium lactatiformans]|nr:glycosyltransferase [Ruthenibacterium lactatiformans]